MTNKIKDYLGIAIIVAILVLAAAGYMYARAYSKIVEPSSFRSFTVLGEGKANAIPDIAEFSFSVVTQGGKDIAASKKENTDKMNAAIDFVKSKGVEAKDIKTQSYNLEPRYTYCYNDRGICPPSEIVGYTITQNVLIKVRDFTKIGDILTGVVERGANQTSNLSFKIDDETSVQNEARAEAIKKAQDKAKSMAKAGGFGIGRLLSIDENNYPMPIYYSKAMGIGGGVSEAASVAPTIEPGSQEITINVTMRYEIK